MEQFCPSGRKFDINFTHCMHLRRFPQTNQPQQNRIFTINIKFTKINGGLSVTGLHSGVCYCVSEDGEIEEEDVGDDYVCRELYSNCHESCYIPQNISSLFRHICRVYDLLSA